MGLFNRKKKENEVLSISGENLIALLEKAALKAREEVEGRYYTVGPEIMFDFGDDVHFAGVRYDKKRAKKDKCSGFSADYMTLYVDKTEFSDIKEVHNAQIDGKVLGEITEGIIVFPEFKDLLEKQ